METVKDYVVSGPISKFAFSLINSLLFDMRMNVVLDFLLKEVARHLKKRGIVYCMWAVNTPEEFEYAISMGANAIMTDSPRILNKFINEKINNK